MKLYSSQYPVELMSKCLGVSRGGYYKWLKINCLKEPVSEVDQQIKTVFEDSRRTYGSPRVAQKLRALSTDGTGRTASAATVARRMQAMGLVARRNKTILSKTFPTVWILPLFEL
jgi:putative transposase